MTSIASEPGRPAVSVLTCLICGDNNRSAAARGRHLAHLAQKVAAPNLWLFPLRLLGAAPAPRWDAGG